MNRFGVPRPSLDTFLRQARQAFEQGRFGEAEGALREAVGLQPQNPGLHNDLGVALLNQGRDEEAAACFASALQLEPEYTDALVNVGRAMQVREDWPGATAAYQRALEKRPDHPVALNNLAVCRRMSGALDEAEKLLRRTVARYPNYPGARCNLGTVLQDRGALVEAEVCFRKLLSQYPNLVEAHTNLANVLREQGRLDDALAGYRAALQIAPQVPGLRWNYALALLQSGDLRNGWREFEWRWQGCQALARARREFAVPQWQGEAGSGGWILLWAEQGLGDTLQFLRYAELVAQRGWQVAVEVPQTLARLAASQYGVARVCVSGSELPDIERHCPLMSLPLCCGSEEAGDIPARVPYLGCEPELLTHWQARIGADQGVRHVGLVWAGNPRPNDPVSSLIDRRRSMALSDLAPLLGLPGIRFHSLQKGPAARQAEEFRELLDWEAQLDDFSQTAGLVANLDLVIGVDTSVVHLAGALGKPIWLLSRFDGCWRWGRSSETTPWYPTMRIFRQAQAGDWAGVTKQVSHSLEEWRRTKG